MELTTKDLGSLKDDLKCKICQELFEIPVVLPCSHLFCKRCVLVIIEKHKNQSSCPMCRQPFGRRSYYDINAVGELCKKLHEIGDQLGVADIAMTQMSQPFVFKPFVPLQHPIKPKAAPMTGDLLSQCLRYSKSQLPPDSEESDDEESEHSKSPQRHPHPLEKSFHNRWLCSQSATGSCLSGMKRNVRTNKECYSCVKCKFYICLKCHADLGYETSVKVTPEPNSQSSSSTSTDDSETSTDEGKCFLCRIPEHNQTQGCSTRLNSIRDRHPDVSDGILWKANASVMSSKLSTLLGPYPVTWRKGAIYRGEKSSDTLRLSVGIHDLCLLWSPQSRISESGTIVPRSIPPAVRHAHNKICSSCGKYGASLTCKKAGCTKSFHVPCGLFTSEVGKIDSTTYTIYCKEHGGDSKTQLKRRKVG